MGVDCIVRFAISTIIRRDDIKKVPEDQSVCLYLRKRIVEDEHPYLVFPGRIDDIFREIINYEYEYEENFEHYYEESFDPDDLATIVIVQKYLLSYKGTKEEESGTFDIFKLKDLDIINVEELSIRYSVKVCVEYED